MEEDIKFIKYYINEYVAVEDIGIEDDFKFQEAIEQLIKAYKEREEKQKSYNTAYNQGKAFENHRWKSLVEEKIEELKNEDLKIYDTDSEDLIIAKYEQRAILNFLQELLEKR